MKLVPWIVALCNRKWLSQLDELATESEPEKEPKPITEVEEDPNSVDDDFNIMMDTLASQPTHLPHKLKARTRRKRYKSKPKPSPKQEALQDAMNEELERMAEGR